MPKHGTRKHVLGAVIALGFTMVLTQGGFARFGEPASAEEETAAAVEAQGAFARFGPTVHAEAGVEAAAETQRRGPRGGPGRAGLLPLRRLDLSDAQEDRIDRIRDEAREAAAEAREPMRDARRELRDAMRGESVEEGRIRELAAAVAALEADALVRRARLRADILEVLTAEQREEVRELQERRRERFAPASRR